MGALEKYKYGGKKRWPIPPVLVCVFVNTQSKRERAQYVLSGL